MISLHVVLTRAGVGAKQLYRAFPVHAMQTKNGACRLYDLPNNINNSTHMSPRTYIRHVWQ